MSKITDAMVEAALDRWYRNVNWRDNAEEYTNDRRDMRAALEAALAVLPKDEATDTQVEAACLEIAPYRCPAVVRGLCANGGDCQCRTIARRALEAAHAMSLASRAAALGAPQSNPRQPLD